ncbi:hypothetical protein [Streptosporangium sp. NPDC051022]|uniref:hypothetical protein n=1 Tax=Streptosporangium sp. NPDC051022 TaxID=3155752 RepID=UPI0034483A67
MRAPQKAPVESGIYRRLLRPLLFRLSAERAHDLTKIALRLPGVWRTVLRRGEADDSRLAADLGGLQISNPIGLSAGLDKDGELVAALQHFGFGYLVVGSVCRYPRAGNPRPRVRRIVPKQALVNCFGLPSKGAERVAGNLAQARRRPLRVPIIGNVCAFDVREFVETAAMLSPYVDAIEVALVCPNSPSRRPDFTTPEDLELLLSELSQEFHKPLFLKLDPYETPAGRSRTLECLDVAIAAGVRAVTMSGSFSRPDSRLSIGRGSVSGDPAWHRNLDFVSAVHQHTRGRLDIKSVGGVTDGRRAFQAIAAGATTCDVLTAFVYHGPALATRISRQLLDLMDSAGVSDITALRGSGHAVPLQA